MLLRHAQAEGNGRSDHLRALSLAGRDQALRAAEHIRDAIPDVVLCSSALRTQQTWQQIAYGMADHGVDTAATTLDLLDSLYQASPHTVLTEVQERAGDADRVLVIGHEPVISTSARELAAPDSDPGAVHTVSFGVATATLAVFEVDPPWSQLTFGQAQLRDILRTPVQ